MAVSQTVQEFMRRSEVPYAVFRHAPAYTAAAEAAVAAVPERHWAKVIICFADGEPIQAVVPADFDVDLRRLAGVVGSEAVRMATEDELEWLFPDCEPGAMPPLGPLYRQLVFVDELLADEDELVFNAGNHIDAISMRFADFVSLTHPVTGRFARPGTH